MIENTETLEQISVPFPQKKRARENGAYFDKKSRKWFIPKKIDADKANILRNLCTTKEEARVVEISEQDIPKNENILMNNDAFNWEQIILSNISLEAALAIMKHGLPNDTETRARLLQVLGNRCPGQYDIEYDSMIKCSEIFANVYPTERIQSLVESVIGGDGRPFMEIINSANISNEEKALLLFVIPL